jgi:multidrug efflux pump subunit AcrB
MVPIGSVATFSDKTGPYRVVRYNLQPAVEIDGDTALASTGQSLTTIEKLADETLAPGYGGEWTDIAYQQSHAGNTPAVVFGMAVFFVFLVLAAQYESLTLPLAIILIVPMCLLAAMLGSICGDGQQHPDANRSGGADRAGGQERHSGGGIRQAGRGRTGMTRWRPRSLPRAPACVRS